MRDSPRHLCSILEGGPREAEVRVPGEDDVVGDHLAELIEAHEGRPGRANVGPVWDVDGQLAPFVEEELLVAEAAPVRPRLLPLLVEGKVVRMSSVQVRSH